MSVFPARVKNQKELIAIIEKWMESLRTDEAVLKVLEEHRIAAAPVMSVAESITHPYFVARNMIRKVPDRILGEVTVPGFPLKFSEFPDLPEIEAPRLGQHGEEILRTLLDMREQEVASLKTAGILYSAEK